MSNFLAARPWLTCFNPFGLRFGEPVMTDKQNNLEAVAAALCALTVSEFAELGASLRDMLLDTPRDLTDSFGWVELLHSWAEAVIEEGKQT